jgi:hypothetical protein
MAVSVAASLPWLACSSSSNAPARDGAAESARPDAGEPDDAREGGAGDAAPVGPYDPNGPYAACNDPLTQASTLVAEGFEAWNDLDVLGCFNPSDAIACTICDDATVIDGGFKLTLSVCTGNRWDVHVFDGTRGLDCNTTRAPVGGVFTITPADCTCGSPNREPATGCEVEGDGGADGDASRDADRDSFSG